MKLKDEELRKNQESFDKASEEAEEHVEKTFKIIRKIVENKIQKEKEERMKIEKEKPSMIKDAIWLMNDEAQKGNYLPIAFICFIFSLFGATGFIAFIEWMGWEISTK